ncbi:MAG: hypothetical protein U5J83_13475 [Bryobacterales bacterium]|nr:hypothetical protein [Bryobacterales bacterium]
MSLFSECELSFEAAQSVSEPSSEPGIASPTPAKAAPSGRRRFRHIERNQPTFVLVDVERMLDEWHPARAIWDLLGGLDLSGFEENVKVYEGSSGRDA